MQINEGVSIVGIQTEIVLALMIAADVYGHIHEELVVTRVLDGEHMDGSSHFTGSAVDIRFPARHSESITTALTNALGKNYDVVLESNHIHIEFQPNVGA